MNVVNLASGIEQADLVKPLLAPSLTQRPVAQSRLLTPSARPVVAQRKCDWTGFIFEHRRNLPTGRPETFGHTYRLILHLSSEVDLQSLPLESVHRLAVTNGRLTVLNAGQTLSEDRRTFSQAMVVALTPEFLHWAANDLVKDPEFIVLRNQDQVEDPLLTSFVLALWAEVEAGYQGGRTYGETLARALAAHLVRQYSVPQGNVEWGQFHEDSERGLGRDALQKSLNYIESHLHTRLLSSDMAATIGLNSNEFSARFKRSTGLSPHQYLLQRRVELAREKLLQTESSVAQIAVDLGFCNQGNLTVYFRRFFDQTPRAYRKQWQKLRFGFATTDPPKPAHSRRRRTGTRKSKGNENN